MGGVRIWALIESCTGISNKMIRAAPPAAEVMSETARFVGDMPLVAHAHAAPPDCPLPAAGERARGQPPGEKPNRQATPPVRS